MMMQKFEKEILMLVCEMEKVFPPAWFNVMQHLLVHLPWEARVGGPVQFKWMYSQERELKKLKATVHNKAMVEGCIAEAFTCKEIMKFSSMYFSRANNVNARTPRYHIVKEVPLSELSIFQSKGKCVGAPSAHYVTYEEWNYTMLCMYTNMMEEVEPYFKKFDKTYWKQSEQPTLKQLNSMREHGVKGDPSFPKWFRQHVVCLFILFLS
jgi:hypothetical protein